MNAYNFIPDLDVSDWEVDSQQDSESRIVKFIINRKNKDGSRDVIKEGRVHHVPRGDLVDTNCGPTVTVPIFELQPRKIF